MANQLSSLLPSLIALGTVAAVALLLTFVREWSPEASQHLPGAARVAIATTLMQAFHFGEELLSGFHLRLPAFFSSPPMPVWFFVSLNLVWLVIWGGSCRGLAGQRRAALFPLWFLGIAGVLNGLVHPLLAIASRGYFPGLLTSPLIGILGVLLLRRLRTLTRSGEASFGAGA